MGGIDGQGQVFSFAVAAGDRKAHIGSALPAVLQARMQALVIGRLFGVVADEGDVVFALRRRRRSWSAISILPSRELTGSHRRSVFEGDVQVARRS